MTNAMDCPQVIGSLIPFKNLPWTVGWLDSWTGFGDTRRRNHELKNSAHTSLRRSRVLMVAGRAGLAGSTQPHPKGGRHADAARKGIVPLARLE